MLPVLSPYYLSIVYITFLLRCPSCPPFFTEVGLCILKVIVALEELFPVILFATGFGVTPLFAAGLAFLLVVCRTFGLFAAFAGGIVPFAVFLVAALLAVKLFFP